MHLCALKADNSGIKFIWPCDDHGNVCMFMACPDVAAPMSLPKRSVSASKTTRSGCWQLLCIAVAVFLLSRSGDVETNPGPGCKCVVNVL